MKTFDHYELKYTVSNEGIMDFIRDLRAGKKPKLNLKWSLNKFILSIPDTYGNIEWVKKRGLNTKPINVYRGSSLDIPFEELYQRAKVIIEHNRKVVDDWLSDNQTIVDAIKKLKDNGYSDNYIKNVKDFVPMKGKFDRLKMPYPKDQQMEPLTAEEVVKAANKIITIEDKITELIKPSNQFLHIYVYYELPKLKSSVPNELKDRFEQLMKFNNYMEKIYDMGDDIAIGNVRIIKFFQHSALASLIDGSVK